MDPLRELLVRHNEEAPLDVAVLQLAEVEFPGLDRQPSLAHLDSLARDLERRAGPSCDGTRFVAEASRLLFNELGFRGNTADYSHPHNSCLNQVLVTRTGLPITLSVLYMEVARRLGRQVHGIGLPGHFLVRYSDPAYATFIDPFHGGRLLTAVECRALALQVVGVDVERQPALLEPVTGRQIVERMLNNLQAAYLQRGNARKALRVLDLMVEASPRSGPLRRQRAAIQEQAGNDAAARADLERCLQLEPQADSREETERQLLRLRRRMATLN